MAGLRAKRVRAILALGKSKIDLSDLRGIFAGQVNRSIRETYSRMIEDHPELPELLPTTRGRPMGSLNKKSNAGTDNEAAKPQKIRATANPYTSGLQVASVEKLPNGEILYKLK